MSRITILFAAFAMTALLAAAPASADETVQGRLDRSSNQLNDGSAFTYYELDLEAGVTYTVELQARGFRPVLWVQDAGDISLEYAAAEDSDGRDSFATISFYSDTPVTGYIIVNALEAGETGSFSLTLLVD